MNATQFAKKYSTLWKNVIEKHHDHKHKVFLDQDMDGNYKKGWITVRELPCGECRKFRKLFKKEVKHG